MLLIFGAGVVAGLGGGRSFYVFGLIQVSPTRRFV